MLIIAPRTPIQRRISLIMIIITLAAAISGGAVVLLLDRLYQGGHIDGMGALPQFFEILFAPWIPSLSATYGQILSTGDATLAGAVLIGQSLVWLVFIAAIAALIAVFVHQWAAILPTMDKPVS